MAINVAKQLSEINDLVGYDHKNVSLIVNRAMASVQPNFWRLPRYD
jgi:hypothetical protein